MTYNSSSKSIRYFVSIIKSTFGGRRMVLYDVFTLSVHEEES